MHKYSKKLFSISMSFLLIISLLSSTMIYGAESDTTTFSDLNVNNNQIVVLYTNDIHGGVSNHSQYSGSSKSLGFAGLAALKEEAAKSAADVTLVDMGDALQGSVICSQSDGLDCLDIMNHVGYDYQVLGNHEFDYGISQTKTFMEYSTAKYLAVNYIDLKENKNISQPYDIKTYNVNGQEIKIGYVGILTPENITKGSVSTYQDEDGNYIYGFCGTDLNEFYGKMQEAVNEMKSKGADYIVALGHLGDEGITDGWSSRELIANTTGIDVFLDGHAHSFLSGDTVKNKEGKNVILSSTGTKLVNIGVLQITLNKDGSLSSKTNLVNQITDEEKELSSYKTIDSYVTGIESKYSNLVRKVGESDFGLYSYNPDTGNRIIRSQETNLGDFITDAFRVGMDADVAFSNGGNIRADLASGELTYLDILNVLPWSDYVVKLEVTGKQLLDCLEMGAHLWPEQCGGFIQTSGLTYDINTDIKPSVTIDENGQFVSVDGEYRVKNVKVGTEPLDLNKTYTLAIDDCYYHDTNDGMTMFLNCKALVDVDAQKVDADLVADYISSKGGTIPEEYRNINGQERIHFINNSTTVKPETPTSENSTTVKEQPSTKVSQITTIRKIAPNKVVIKKARKTGKKIDLKLKALKRASGYHAQISYKRNFKKIVKSKFYKKAKFKMTLSKKTKKKVYVRVRAYISYGKVKKFGKWSKIKVVK